MGFLWFLLGAIVGYILACVVTAYRSTVGNLRVDRSIPDEEPYIFLELNKGVGDITRRKHVTLVVKNENYLSHD